MPAWNLSWAFVLILLAGIGSILVACVPTPDVITRPTGVPTLTRGADAASSGADATSAPAAVQCEPSRPDAMGPFYKPNAPFRAAVGTGYLLSGRVLAVDSCRPLPGALIEFWLAGPQGQYDDDYRASMTSGSQGEYQFQSAVPVPYAGRPPHVHVRVSAPGFRTLVTQNYPGEG